MRVVQQLDFGDVAGHPFHGNQYTGDQGEKEQLLRRIAGMKATKDKQRWDDYWRLGYDAAQSKDPEVAAIGKALMDAAMGKKTESTSAQQILEFEWDESLHPRDSRGRFGTGDGEAPGANKKQSAKNVEISDKYKDRLITDTAHAPGESELSKKIADATAGMAPGIEAWITPVPTLNSTYADTKALIDRKEASGEYTPEQAKAARDYTDWRVQANKAGQGFGESPGRFDSVNPEAAKEMARNGSGDDSMYRELDSSLRGGLDPNSGPTPRWRAENDQEALDKVAHDIYSADRWNHTGFDPADPQGTASPNQLAALEHADFLLGRSKDDSAFEELSPYAQKKYGELVDKALNPTPLIAHTDQLNSQLLAAEQTTRDIGGLVQDRAAEIRQEQGMLDLEDVRGRYKETVDEERAALDRAKVVNAEFGLPNSFSPSHPYESTGRYKTVDGEWKDAPPPTYPSWERLSDEQKADYILKYGETGATAAKEAADQIREDVRNAELDRRESTFAALREVRDFGPGDTGGFNILRQNDAASIVVRASERYYPTDWIRESNKGNVMDVRETNGRGYYRNITASDKAAMEGAGSDLRFSNSSTDFGERGQSVMTHELGHRMEYTLPEVTAAEFTFRERRTQGDQLERLGSGYRRDEKSLADEFFDPYVGKNYGNRTSSSYEVFTMGMQSLVERGYVGKGSLGLVGDVKIDHEHEQLILGILATAGKKR